MSPLPPIADHIDALCGKLALIEQIVVGRHPFCQAVDLVEHPFQTLILEGDLTRRQNMLVRTMRLPAHYIRDGIEIGPTGDGLPRTR